MKNLVVICLLSASVQALPQYYFKDTRCQAAPQAQQKACQDDVQYCRNLFTEGEADILRRKLYKECLDEFDLYYLDDISPEVVFSPFGPEALRVFGNGYTWRQFKKCIHRKRGGVKVDGTIDPEPFLNNLRRGMGQERPDILERIVKHTPNCPTAAIDQWFVCVLSACGHVEEDPGKSPEL
ncbi:uncharacterized protein LOC143022220 [Oratosquilla oratoria]|uniref:uncharacterized protein LOC143022220 n=1 Tax=Oratosquilla oratoria TaxID=337810 RepID=UPI003F773DB5